MGDRHSLPCVVLLFKRAEQWYNMLCSVGSYVLMVSPTLVEGHTL